MIAYSTRRPRQSIDGGFHWSYDHYDVGILISTFVLALLLAWPLLDLPRLSIAVQFQVLLVTLAAALVGGVIGAFQGDWLARFSR